MPEHTAGPWIYRRPTMAQPSAWIYGQDERPVCELNDNRNEYEANARLIAAAPTMFAALREIALVDLSGDGGADLCMCHTFQAVAKEALARVEGRA